MNALYEPKAPETPEAKKLRVAEVGRDMENKKWAQFLLDHISHHELIFLTGHAKDQVDQNPKILEILRSKFSGEFPREQLGEDFPALILDMHEKGRRSRDVLVIRRESLPNEPTKIVPTRILPGKVLQELYSTLKGANRAELKRFFALQGMLIVESEGSESLKLFGLLTSQLDSAGNNIVAFLGPIINRLPKQGSEDTSIPPELDKRKSPMAFAYVTK